MEFCLGCQWNWITDQIQDESLTLFQILLPTAPNKLEIQSSIRKTSTEIHCQVILHVLGPGGMWRYLNANVIVPPKVTIHMWLVNEERLVN